MPNNFIPEQLCNILAEYEEVESITVTLINGQTVVQTRSNEEAKSASNREQRRVRFTRDIVRDIYIAVRANKPKWDYTRWAEHLELSKWDISKIMRGETYAEFTEDLRKAKKLKYSNPENSIKKKLQEVS